jgi:hypothetical protein
MIATLQLEAIGDNYRRLAGLPIDQVIRRLGNVPSAHKGHVLDPKRRPWVALIRGRSEQYGLDREFLDGFRDYRGANGVGSRGVMITFVLHPGKVYEVHELISWSRERRYMCHVVAGAIVVLTQDQALAILDGGQAAAQAVIAEASRS